MRLPLCLTICLMPILSYAQANEGKYTFIAPDIIHSNDKYTVALAVHQFSQPCQIKVGITGFLYKETKQVDVSENEVKNVDFDLPYLEEGDYELTFEGVNCLNNFKNTTRLIRKKFYNHVILQTDKVLYQPEEYIHFRVLFLDKNLKPTEPSKNDVIWIEDGQDNRIKEIRDFKVVNGVYTGNFKISNLAVTGQWFMGVKNGDEFDHTTSFNVQKNVLPIFEVKVEAEKFVSVKDDDMQVIVMASYTYGKPLDGKVIVILSLPSRSYLDPSQLNRNKETKETPTLIKTANMIKGKAKVDLNIKEYDGFLPYTGSSVDMTIVATVVEQSTGVTVNGTSYSIVYPNRFSINCISDGTCSTFVADKEQVVLFEITNIDRSYVNDTKSPIELTYTPVFLSESRDEMATDIEPPVAENLTISFQGHMNETGFVDFRVSLPNLPEGYLNLYTSKLEYLNEQYEFDMIYQYTEQEKVEAPEGGNKEEEEEKDAEKSEKYFMFFDNLPLTKKLKLNKPDKFTLKSSLPLPYINYIIIGRANVLKSGHIDLPDRPKVYNLTLTPELLWAPIFGIYAFYVGETGEYHWAEQRFYINFELQNEINVTAAEQVRPGQKVSLKIQTTHNSFVGITAIEQNDLLFRNKHDLNLYDFNRIVDSYNTYTPQQAGNLKNPGSTLGCVTLTNADYLYNWTRPDYLSNLDILRNNIDRKTVAPMELGAQGKVGFLGESTFDSGPASGLYSLEHSKDFSETWLFTDIKNTRCVEFTLSKQAPETISSWSSTAFSMHPTKGLGVTRAHTKIKTFVYFLMSIRFPYSVKRGEFINVHALVFNYLNKTLDVDVTLDNSDDEYEFTEFDSTVISKQKLTKSTSVPANGAAGVYFLLRLKDIGNVMLKFKAISPLAGDVKHKSMKVVPEGVTQYANRAYYVNLKEKPEVMTNFTLELPKDLVPDSQHVSVGVTGDILAPAIENSGNLVRLPIGCGEQAMSVLLSNYLILKYLQNSNRLTSIKETELLHNLDIGYQSLLNYRHIDGSFSSFGPREMEDRPSYSSTCLTAYVVRYLQQIKEFVSVSDNTIKRGLAFLSRQQAPNGTFTENGDCFCASQRNDITLTGTVILALTESVPYTEIYSQEIEKGLDFIAQNIDKANSLHAQAVGTYTLNKAKHDAAEENLFKLKSSARTESDRMWWSTNIGHVFSKDVETTSYALLTLLDQDSTQLDDVLPIIKWLIVQRNSNGGFASTQDTVIGLMALIEFAKFSNNEPVKMNVNIKSRNKNVTVELTKDNEIVYENIEMSPTTKNIQFTAKGTGTALVQISHQYNSLRKESEARFTITTKKIENKNRPSRLEMLTCVNFLGEKSSNMVGAESSNMAVMEFSTPSGYVIDTESLKEIEKLERVSITKLEKSATMLVVYFDHLFKNDETCLLIVAIRTHDVAMQKSASIQVYDYYEPSRRATAFYEAESKLCDICEGEEQCSSCK